MPSRHFGEVPSEGVDTIVMWGGDMSNIPAGWVFCDGNNGTPDLRDRFVKSVPDGSTNPGTRAGQNSYTISTSQMAEHSHSVSLDNAGSHRHTGAQVAGGEMVYNSDEDGAANAGSASTDAGSHDHTISVNDTGSDNAVDNRPAHVEIAFIMKT